MGKNSRKDGVLYIECKHPFKIAVDGQEVERQKIIAHDITYNVEDVAFNLEQYLRVALLHMPAIENATENKKIAAADDKKAEQFYNNESPSSTEIEEQANLIQMMMEMNKEVLISKMMQEFTQIIYYNLLKVEGNINMTMPIWTTLHRDDKAKVLFSYIAFFVNPLQKLQNQSILMEKQGLQGEMKKT